MLKFHDEDGQREYLWIYGPAVLLGCIALLVTYQFVDPAPPNHIVIATGGPNGAYHAYAERYRDILARDHVDLEVLETDGSLANLALLGSPDSGVDVAFVQGGTGSFATVDTLTSLASLYYEPLWFFKNAAVSIKRPADIVGKRISIGPTGSGTRALSLVLLGDAGFTENELEISPLAGMKAANALREGSLELMMLVASPESELVQTLLQSDQVNLLSFARAEAYTRRHRFLSKLTMPEGSIDLARNLPSHDVELLAPTANLVASERLHPALVDLLLEAAQEVHGQGGLFEQPGAFPSPNYLIFPLNDEARRFFESGPPFLRRTLPFWAATLIDRLALMLLPLIAVIIPLMRIMPPLYKWRVRRRVYKWYKELRMLERDIQNGRRDDDAADCHTDLDRMDAEVRKVKIPWAYAEELYQLRLHIRYVHDVLDERVSPSGRAASGTGPRRQRALTDGALEDAS